MGLDKGNTCALNMGLDKGNTCALNMGLDKGTSIHRSIPEYYTYCYLSTLFEVADLVI